MIRRKSIGEVSAGSGLELAFADAVAVTFNGGEVGMMSKAVEKGGDTGSVREDGVPFSEGTIGCNED